MYCETDEHNLVERARAGPNVWNELASLMSAVCFQQLPVRSGDSVIIFSRASSSLSLSSSNTGDTGEKLWGFIYIIECVTWVVNYYKK